jgi:hypothetical protein
LVTEQAPKSRSTEEYERCGERLAGELGERSHSSDIVDQPDEQEHDRREHEPLPPNEIKPASDLGPWAGDSDKASRMETQKNSQTSTPGGWAFVWAAFIRQIHDSESHRETTNDRGKKVCHHKPGEQDCQIFVKIVKHKSIPEKQNAEDEIIPVFYTFP